MRIYPVKENPIGTNKQTKKHTSRYFIIRIILDGRTDRQTDGRTDIKLFCIIDIVNNIFSQTITIDSCQKQKCTSFNLKTTFCSQHILKRKVFLFLQYYQFSRQQFLNDYKSKHYTLWHTRDIKKISSQDKL